MLNRSHTRPQYHHTSIQKLRDYCLILSIQYKVCELVLCYVIIAVARFLLSLEYKYSNHTLYPYPLESATYATREIMNACGLWSVEHRVDLQYFWAHSASAWLG